MKKCGKCKQLKSDFSRNKTRKDGLADWCRDCMRTHLRADYQKHREKRLVAQVVHNTLPEVKQKKASQSRKKLYNLSDGEYERLLASQNGVCKICRKLCSTGKRLSVDHDHKTKVIRGLLCYKCNVGIGFFQDDARLCLEAAFYLRLKGVSINV